jgi:translation initiation factor 3 subunit F
MSSLGMLQKLDVAAFEKMFNNSLQDLLMVTYLSNLTRAQLALAERLQGNI